MEDSSLSIPQEIIFLFILLGLGIVTKNQTIIISVAFLLLIRMMGLQNKVYPYLDKYGIKIGITVIMVAVLIPIASGEIKLTDLVISLKSSAGIISILAGIIVAILGSYGIQLLDKSPQMTISLVMGVIFAIIFLKGIPVGPLIGAGIAMFLMKLFEILKTFFT